MERDGPVSAVVTEGIHTAEASVGGNQMLHHRPHLCVRHRCVSRSVPAVSPSPTAAVAREARGPSLPVGHNPRTGGYAIGRKIQVLQAWNISPSMALAASAPPHLTRR